MMTSTDTRQNPPTQHKHDLRHNITGNGCTFLYCIVFECDYFEIVTHSGDPNPINHTCG